LNKVLIIRFSSLGDVVLSSVVLDPLYSKNYKIDFLVFEEFASIFKDDYRIENLISVNKKELKDFKSIKRFAEKLKGKYDYVIDLHSNLRSFLISSLIGGRRIKYKKNSLKRRLYIYPFFRKFLKDDFNVVNAYLSTLENFYIDNLYLYRPKLVLRESEIEAIRDKLPKNFVVIGSGARYKKKFYPHYDKVADILLEKGFNVILVGSKSDREMDRGNYPKDVIDLRGELSLRESIAVISQGIGTISNDSAIAHISRAVRVPVLMVYGATHPYFGFYPLEDEGDYIQKDLPCRPCDLHGKGECKLGNFECLNISPNLIVDRFLNTIKKTPSKNLYT